MPTSSSLSFVKALKGLAVFTPPINHGSVHTILVAALLEVREEATVVGL